VSGAAAGPAPQLAAALRAAAAALAEAGVASPEHDAVALAAHLLDVSYGEVRRRAVLGAAVPPGFAELVAQRVRRVPLQHLTGRAPFRRLELAVGPGVFVPRPETEVLVTAVLAELTTLSGPAGPAGPAGLAGPSGPSGPSGPREQRASGADPMVVDLCTGSGAIAVAIAVEHPTSRVWAVELSPEAAAYARANIAAHAPRVRLIVGDGAAPHPELASVEGCVDVVTCNPPYIPDGMVPLDQEVRDHDPELALYGRSADGLAVPLAMAARAAELLRPGGLLAMEHADAQGESLPAALAAAGDWVEIQDIADLAGRPRVSVARRA